MAHPIDSPHRPASSLWRLTRMSTLVPALVLTLGAGAGNGPATSSHVRVEDAVAGPADSATDPPAQVTADGRPIVRLRVRNRYNPEEVVLAQVVEGRLIASLADMETFRMVSADRKGDYLLDCAITDLYIAADDSFVVSRDAESSGRATPRNQLTISMELTLRLEDAASREVYAGKLATQASREIAISIESTAEAARTEAIDRAAVRLEKILRKQLKKRK
jgi:hypothetical protein